MDFPGEVLLDAVTFLRGDRVVLDEVDALVSPGAVTAIVGPNGAGKSTLLHVMAGLERPASGQVRLDGEPIAPLSRRQLARRVALVDQQAESEASLRVRDVVMLGRLPHQSRLGGPTAADLAVVDDALRTTRTDRLADRMFHQLSGGERQRVLLGRALAQAPAVLLLDEPTNHLDIGAQLDVLHLLRSLADRGVSVAAAIHDLNLAAAHCDHVLVISQARVVAAGAPGAVLTPDLLRAVYDVDVEIVTTASGRPQFVFTSVADDRRPRG